MKMRKNSFTEAEIIKVLNERASGFGVCAHARDISRPTVANISG
jgi:hypothetical protein